ncbi:hypothetical protein CI15_00820 [Paraburkholderia monticola]|uniref:Uncharacterized protein n=1 Tax=Paraburkholderia monticola TaxID=1399968 RepID=A0A149Q1F7_9BURK|nr:hypothetical protein CI15_00820 [Paraburkholderia monticola]
MVRTAACGLDYVPFLLAKLDRYEQTDARRLIGSVDNGRWRVDVVLTAVIVAVAPGIVLIVLISVSVLMSLLTVISAIGRMLLLLVLIVVGTQRGRNEQPADD